MVSNLADTRNADDHAVSKITVDPVSIATDTATHTFTTQRLYDNDLAGLLFDNGFRNHPPAHRRPDLACR
jgi:hypothetical protein